MESFDLFSFLFVDRFLPHLSRMKNYYRMDYFIFVRTSFHKKEEAEAF